MTDLRIQLNVAEIPPRIALKHGHAVVGIKELVTEIPATPVINTILIVHVNLQR